MNGGGVERTHRYHVEKACMSFLGWTCRVASLDTHRRWGRPSSLGVPDKTIGPRKQPLDCNFVIHKRELLSQVVDPLASRHEARMGLVVERVFEPLFSTYTVLPSLKLAGMGSWSVSICKRGGV